MTKTDDLLELYGKVVTVGRSLTTLAEHLPEGQQVHATTAKKELEKCIPGLVASIGQATLEQHYMTIEGTP